MSVNKVILIGNVGRDPDVRYPSQDVAVASFSLATSQRGYTTSNGITVPEKTEWHNIVAWRSLAKFCENYVKKGTQLYIEGKLQYRSYEKDGVTRYITEIVANEIQFTGNKNDNQSNTSYNNNKTAAPANNGGNINMENDDSIDNGDDLPF